MKKNKTISLDPNLSFDDAMRKLAHVPPVDEVKGNRPNTKTSQKLLKAPKEVKRLPKPKK